MLSVKTPRDLTNAAASVDTLEMGKSALVIIQYVMALRKSQNLQI